MEDAKRMTVGAYVVVLYSGEKYMLVHMRSPRIRHGGTICSPGGSVDPRETPLSACIRELYEEAGVKVNSKMVNVLPPCGSGSNGNEYKGKPHKSFLWILKSFPEVAGPSKRNWFEVSTFDFSKLKGAFPLVKQRHAWVPIDSLIDFIEKNESYRHEGFLEVVRYISSIM